MEQFAALDQDMFLYSGIFLGVIVLFEGLRQTVSLGSSKRPSRSHRIRKLQEHMKAGKPSSLLIAPTKHNLLARIPVYGTLPAKMQQAGMSMSPRMFLGVCAGIAFALFIFFAMTLGPAPAAAVSVLSGMVIPMSIINIVRKRRVLKFTQQLPDALDLMMRGLRVGHPLNATIANVAKNMPDPIGTEFGIMSNQITYGDKLSQAMNDMANRIDQEDMHYLAVAVNIQHGTGGNLGKMLNTLATVIRRRFAMRRKVRALSSEGRVSAMILSALPVVMYTGTLLTAPDYYSGVQDDPLFKPAAAAVIILVVSNYLMLRKLVNFRL